LSASPASRASKVALLQHDRVTFVNLRRFAGPAPSRSLTFDNLSLDNLSPRSPIRNWSLFGKTVGASMIRLVAAFLAAANAACSIAGVNLNIQNHDERLAAVMCTLGFLAAVGSAIADHSLRRRSQSPGLELRYYRTHVGFTGERNLQREAILEDQMRRAARFYMVAPVMVATSAILLVAGITLIAFR
jgi:hypothetical protein